ncbi:MAG: hypothetical protein IPK82_04430 [Polyangiaceae bacterium]|nr:hypothetical protein [Polyangiaceae bacterium]
MPPPSDPRNLRAKWQRALEERRKSGNAEAPVDVTPRAAKPKTPEKEAPEQSEQPSSGRADPPSPRIETQPKPEKTSAEESSNKDGEPKKKATAPSSSVWSSVGAALVLVGGVGFALRTFITEASPSTVEEDPPVPSAAPMESPPNVSADPSAKPAPKARCPAPNETPFVIGDAPPPKTSVGTDGEDSHEDELQPFAVEVGRGVVTPDGFAIGAQRPGEGGTISMVATLDTAGKNGRLIRLARSRGDFDPPVVATAGNVILAAMMEPHASGRSIRTAKVEGDRVTWGPELSESNDESTAMDIASHGPRAVLVWDDVPLGRERSVIQLATFDVYTMSGGGARPVTPPSLDADVPHIVKRPGVIGSVISPTVSPRQSPQHLKTMTPMRAPNPVNPRDPTIQTTATQRPPVKRSRTNGLKLYLSTTTVLRWVPRAR